METDRRRGRPSATSLCVVSIAGFALSAGALVLAVPTLFSPGAKVHPWIYVVLASLAGAFAVGARHWRPPTSRPGRR